MASIGSNRTRRLRMGANRAAEIPSNRPRAKIVTKVGVRRLVIGQIRLAWGSRFRYFYAPLRAPAVRGREWKHAIRERIRDMTRSCKDRMTLGTWLTRTAHQTVTWRTAITREAILRMAALGLAVHLTAPFALAQGGPQGPPGPAMNQQTFQERVAQAGGPVYGPVTKKLVADVRIKGNESLPEHEIFQHLRTRRDREFDPEVVQADVRRLASTGRFADVETFTEETPGGVVVTFQLQERPAIRYIRFHGNRGIGDQRLTANSGLKLGDPINRFAVREARRKTEEMYHDKGFALAQVDVVEGDKPGDRGVVLQVREGPVERIESVNFIGNTVVSDARLRTQIESKPGVLWYLLRGKVDREKINADVEKLTAYYRNLGYFNARIGREMKYDDSGKWLKLTFVIDEGPRYRIRNVSIRGADRFASEELQQALSLASGEFFNLTRMQTDVNALKDLYGGNGYIFAKVQADPRFLEEPGMLDLTYEIEEGNRWRVGEINVHIRGENPHTRESVVLNRISLRPGDIVDIREVRASERRLRYSQLFRNNPAQGVAPRIVMRAPELDELESLADESGGNSYRGQSPSGQASGGQASGGQASGGQTHSSRANGHQPNARPSTARPSTTWQPTAPRAFAPSRYTQPHSR